MLLAIAYLSVLISSLDIDFVMLAVGEYVHTTTSVSRAFSTTSTFLISCTVSIPSRRRILLIVIEEVIQPLVSEHEHVLFPTLLRQLFIVVLQPRQHKLLKNILEVASTSVQPMHLAEAAEGEVDEKEVTTRY